jgi:hypothetical protein
MGWSTHQNYERILGIVADLSNMKTPKILFKNDGIQGECTTWNIQ